MNSDTVSEQESTSVTRQPRGTLVYNREGSLSMELRVPLRKEDGALAVDWGRCHPDQRPGPFHSTLLQIGPGTRAKGDVRPWHEGATASPYPGLSVNSSIPSLQFSFPNQHQLFPLNVMKSLSSLQDCVTVKNGATSAFPYLAVKVKISVWKLLQNQLPFLVLQNSPNLDKAPPPSFGKTLNS